MANTVISPGGTHERQERYAKSIVKLLRKNLVTNEQDIFSRDYEGDPKAGAVKVPVRNTEVSVVDYNIATGAALDTSATTYLDIPIDNNKAINEIVDGYEASAVPDNLMAQRLDSGSYALGLVIDTDGIATLEAEGTTSSNITASTTSTAYANFMAENLALDLADVPMDNRFSIVSPTFYSLIKQDDAFVNAASDTGFNEVKKAGFVGSIDGVRIYRSNNVAAATEFIIGSKLWAQRIDEWKVLPNFKDLTNEFIGSSALQGRMVYKHKLTNALTVRVKTFV